MFKRYKYELIRETEKKEKLLQFYYLLVHWVGFKQKGIGLADLLILKGIRTVAIYGMKELGELLCSELEGTGVDILYTIDRDGREIYTKYPILSPEDELDKVDAIIVTAISAYSDIKKYLECRCNYPVMSLEDLVFEVE